MSWLSQYSRNESHYNHTHVEWEQEGGANHFIEFNAVLHVNSLNSAPDGQTLWGVVGDLKRKASRHWSVHMFF